jgi:PAS domain S-box-containing protein
MRVLLIEDNPGDARLIEEMLAEAGNPPIYLEEAGRLDEGLELLARERCDALLLDLGLPDSRGLDTLRRTLSYAPGVPVVVLTGLEDEKVGLEAVKEGAQDYLVKGKVGPELLSRSIHYAVQRKRAQEQLRESEEMYRTLTETSPDAITLADLEGNIIVTSRRTLELHGYEDADELLGMSSLYLIAPQDRSRALANMSKTLKEGVVRDLEYTMLKKDGSSFTGELSAALLKDSYGGPRAFIAVTKDITALKSIRARVEMINHLFLSMGPDFLDNMEKIVRAGKDILGGSEAAYSRLQDERFSMISTVPGEGGLLFTGDPEAYLSYRVISDCMDAPLVVADLGESLYGDIDPFMKKLGLRTFLGYPVRWGDETIGCLSIYYQENQGFTHQEIEIAGMLARALSIEEERLTHIESLKDFIDVASHELRHPITIIKGYAASLREQWGQLDEERRNELLNAVEYGADRLNRLVMKLLDISRIERGDFPVSIQEVALEPIVKSVIREIKVRDYSNEVSSSISEDIGLVQVDPDRLGELLLILVENAILYSAPGSRIDISGEIKDEMVLVSIMDQGIGIHRDQQSKIFERFYQVEDALHHSVPGMGMGLYIAREIVEAHKGMIWCEPREGGGSVFYFTFPRQ